MRGDMGADESEDSTFADVLNELSGSKPARKAPPPPAPTPQRPARPPRVEAPVETDAAIVRAYTWTGGRTRSSIPLEIETLVSTTQRAEALMNGLRSEHQAVAQLCRRAKSVAEIGALLSLPLNVVRVLLEDMARLGLVEVHQAVSGDTPDLELLHRVLRGLTNLRG
jgi:Protein of unknown function (DUF742)